jgi:hypothetical protein
MLSKKNQQPQISKNEQKSRAYKWKSKHLLEQERH